MLTAVIRIHEGLIGPGPICGSCEKVSVWDWRTGRVLRKIRSPGRDIYSQIRLSREGDVLVGYVGKEKNGFIWRDMEQADVIVDSKFQLFDFRTGTVLATSRDLRGDDPNRVNFNTPCVLRFGAKGRRVLVYWMHGGPPPTIYEISGSPR